MNKGYGVVFTLSLLLGLATHAGARTEQINIQGFAFQPGTATVSLGDSMRWTNLDAVPHSATSDSGPGTFNSGLLAQNQSYAFQFTVAGTYRYHCSVHLTMIGRIVVSPNGVEEGRSQAPGSGLILFPNQPNPFSDQTRISFQLPKEGPVSLEVYDLLGHRVNTLVQGTLEAGGHEVTWNGRTAFGNRVAPGVYLYRLVAEGKALTHRLALVR
jgi:plastocyanin